MDIKTKVFIKEVRLKEVIFHGPFDLWWFADNYRQQYMTTMQRLWAEIVWLPYDVESGNIMIKPKLKTVEWFD